MVQGNLEQGTYYSPDDPPSGPSSGPEIGENRSLLKLLLPLVMAEIDPATGFDPDTETEPSAFQKSTERQALHDMAENHWKANSAGLGLPDDGWELIINAAEDVWRYSNYSKANGKPASTESIVGALAQTYCALEKVMGAGSGKRGFYKDLIERMMDKIKSGGRNLQREFYWEEVEKKIEKLEKDEAVRVANEEKVKKQKAIEVKIEKEKRERAQLLETANRFAEALVALGPKKLKAIKSRLVLNTLVDEPNRQELKDVLGDEAINLMGYGPLGKSRKSHAFFYEVLRMAYDGVEYPRARMAMREKIVRQLSEHLVMGKEAAKEYVKDLLEPVQWSYFIGEVTPELQTVLPVDLAFRDYAEELDAVARVVGYNPESGKMERLGELVKKIASGLGVPEAEGLSEPEEDSMRQRMVREFMDEARENRQLAGMMMERGVESYIFLPQNQEWILGARALYKQAKEKRLSWFLRNTMTMVRAGRNPGMARMYATAAGGDAEAPAEESTIVKGLEWVSKGLALEGYFDRKTFDQQFGFHSPEVLSEIMERRIPMRAWVREYGEGEGVRPRLVDFSLSAKDVRAEISTLKAMSELKTNKGLGADSHASALYKYLRRAILRQMGYTYEQLDLWDEQQDRYARNVEKGMVGEAERDKASWRSHYPEVVKTNLISFSDHLDIEDLNGLVGDNWGMVMTAYSDIIWSREDILNLPFDDFSRTENLAGRPARAHYRNKYNIPPTPPGTTWAEIMLMGDWTSYSMEATTVRPLQNDELITSGLNLNEPVGRALLKLRRQCIDRLFRVNQVSPDDVLDMSQLMLGLGWYEPEGANPKEKFANWEREANKGFGEIGRLGIFRARPWDLCGAAAIEFDVDLLQEAGLWGKSEAQILEAVWTDMPFKKWIENAGANSNEIARMEYRQIIDDFTKALARAGKNKDEVQALTNVREISELRKNYENFWIAQKVLVATDDPQRPDLVRQVKEGAVKVFERGRRELRGIYGYQQFTQNVSYSLVHRSKATYKDPNSETRYPEKAEGAIAAVDAVLKMVGFDMYAEAPDPEMVDSGTLHLLGREKSKNLQKTVSGYMHPYPAKSMVVLLGRTIPQLLEKMKEEMAKVDLGGYVPSVPKERLHRALMMTVVQHVMAVSLDTPIYEVDVDDPDFGTYNSLTTKPITREVLRKRWAKVFTEKGPNGEADVVRWDLVDKVERVLGRHMVHSVETLENRLKPEKERLAGQKFVGPNSGEVPSSITAGQFLVKVADLADRLIDKEKLAGRERSPISLQAVAMKEMAEEMLGRGYFWWAGLRGKANMGPYELMKLAEGLTGSRLTDPAIRVFMGNLNQLLEKNVTTSTINLGPYLATPKIDVVQKIAATISGVDILGFTYDVKEKQHNSGDLKKLKEKYRS